MVYNWKLNWNHICDTIHERKRHHPSIWEAFVKNHLPVDQMVRSIELCYAKFGNADRQVFLCLTLTQTVQDDSFIGIHSEAARFQHIKDICCISLANMNN